MSGAILALFGEGFQAVLGKTLSSLLWKALTQAYEVIVSTLRRRSTIRDYSEALSSQIREMPFIYKDIELNAVDDFVDVELRTIDTKTLTSRTPVAQTSVVAGAANGRWWQLTSNRKVVLMGEAGIGKTTIFRHLVLTILSEDKTSAVYPKDQKLIPVFVPLKAIDSNSASPVMRYLTDTYPQFSGKRGIKLLGKLAKNKRLIVFLDGYDEIPYAGGTELIKSELESFFADNKADLSWDIKSDFAEIYNDILSCRVLMSTRREFFSTYRLNVGVNTR